MPGDATAPAPAGTLSRPRLSLASAMMSPQTNRTHPFDGPDSARLHFLPRVCDQPWLLRPRLLVTLLTSGAEQTKSSSLRCTPATRTAAQSCTTRQATASFVVRTAPCRAARRSLTPQAWMLFATQGAQRLWSSSSSAAPACLRTRRTMRRVALNTTPPCQPPDLVPFSLCRGGRRSCPPAAWAPRRRCRCC